MIHRRGMLLFALLLCGAGCARQQDAGQIREAESAYLRALETERSGDHAAARDLYRQASERGGLQVDEYVECLIRLALCETRLGNHDDAHAALDAIAEGATDLGRFHAARAFVYRQQERIAEADKEERLAKQADPKVQKISK